MPQASYTHGSAFHPSHGEMVETMSHGETGLHDGQLSKIVALLRAAWVGGFNLKAVHPPKRAAGEYENRQSRKIARHQMRRKTTTQKIIEGDARQRGKGVLQRKLAAEPHAAHGLPDAPEHLSARARAAWDFWREQLELMQLDHAPDAIALEGACVNYARAVEADLIVMREGQVVDEPVFYQSRRLSGIRRKKKHPAVTVANSAWLLMKAFCCEFGMTPLSRTRLTIEPRRQDARDDLDKLLHGPRLTATERGRQ